MRFLLLLGWSASLVGWRPSLLGWRPSIASKLEAIAISLEAIASRVEAIAIRLELEATSLVGWRPSEAIAIRCCLPLPLSPLSSKASWLLQSPGQDSSEALMARNTHSRRGCSCPTTAMIRGFLQSKFCKVDEYMPTISKAICNSGT